MVDVEGPHWPRVSVALGYDDVGLSRHDFRGVVQDDVTVLPACDQDTRRMAFGVHPIGTPHQFMISVGGRVSKTSTCERKGNIQRKQGEFNRELWGLSQPVSGGDAAT